MKEITTHVPVGLTPRTLSLDIHAVDEPGSGGAHHRYDITGFDTATNPSSRDPIGYVSSFSSCIILFQNGPLLTPVEQYPNGVTHEALLAIVADRLTDFQAGPFACDENAVAEFERAVDVEVSAGWVPQGGLAVTYNAQLCRYTYLQAMIRYDDELGGF
jgi:hypothetical protein